MLNRHNLEIANLAQKADSRYSLCSIYVTPKETVVTDGHMLLEVSTVEIPSDNFPPTPGCTPTDEFTPFMIEKAAALDIAKAIPKKEPIPVLMTAAIGSESNVNGHAVIAVNDLENKRVFCPKKVEGKFPNYKPLIPEIGSETLAIRLDPKILVPLLKEMQKIVGDNGVVFRFRDNESAVRIDAKDPYGEQKEIGLIMPMKLG